MTTFSTTHRLGDDTVTITAKLRPDDDPLGLGDDTVTITRAAGLKGILCRGAHGAYFLRVKQADGGFKDYTLLHSDLSITIDVDEHDAALYESATRCVLDHAPDTLGLTLEATASAPIDA